MTYQILTEPTRSSEIVECRVLGAKPVGCSSSGVIVRPSSSTADHSAPSRTSGVFLRIVPCDGAILDKNLEENSTLYSR